jgi:hypothetical protein
VHFRTERRKKFGPLPPKVDCHWRREGFFPRISTRHANSFGWRRGAPREKNIRLLRALRLRGSQKVAFLQSTTNGSHFRRSQPAKQEFSRQTEHTLFTPSGHKRRPNAKRIIFPEDSATLGQLSIWPRGGLLLEKCLTFAFFWPWAISPSAALAHGVAQATRGNRYGIGTVRPPCQNCRPLTVWQSGKDTRTQSGMS